MDIRLQKVGIIGSGIMGTSIAAHCAGCGLDVILLDIVPLDLNDQDSHNPDARNRIADKNLAGALKSSPPLFYDSENDIKRITTGNLEDDLSLLKECDLIIEAVLEDLQVKQGIYEQIEQIRQKKTIIATTTSGLPVNILSRNRSKEFRNNFIGTHFFNPVRYTGLLEIIPGSDTFPAVTDVIKKWASTTLGKGIVVAKDTPGFIANRIGGFMMCMALRLMDKKPIPIATADKLFGPLFGFPKSGIFGLADMVGLDTLMYLAKNFYKILRDDEFREVFNVPDFFDQMVNKGMLGRKTPDQGGFYKYEIDAKTKRKLKKSLNIKTFEFETCNKKFDSPVINSTSGMGTPAEKQRSILFGEGRESEWAWEFISSTLVYSAQKIPEIAQNIVQIDNAMKWGYNWEAGPFEIWDNLGLEQSIIRIEAEGLTLPGNIHKMISAGAKSFYRTHNGKHQYWDFETESYQMIKKNPKEISLKLIRSSGRTALSCQSCSLLDLGDGVYNLAFHTKMNTINREIIHFLEKSNEFVQKNGCGLIIGNDPVGLPGTFSAGADLSYMLNLARSGNFSEMDSFVLEAHKNILSTRYSPFPVVAAPFGITIGGGCELCLIADRIVAHADLNMGLVETGSGLIPGGGGCTNLWRKTISTAASSRISDMIELFKKTFETIATARVSSSAAEAGSLGFLQYNDRIIKNRNHLIGEAKNELLKIQDEGYHPPVPVRIPVMGEDASGMVEIHLYNLYMGGYITEYDRLILRKLAYVLSGGETFAGNLISEEEMLKLERETFISLWKEPKTIERAEYILNTGKPLRN